VNAGEEMRQKLYTPVQHCNDATRFKQVENHSRNHALQKRTRCQCMHENGSVLALYLWTKGIPLSMHWFDATTFCERNKSQTM